MVGQGVRKAAAPGLLSIPAEEGSSEPEVSQHQVPLSTNASEASLAGSSDVGNADD